MKTYLDDIQIHYSFPFLFERGSIIAVDIEIFHAEKERLHRPTGDFASLACTANGKDVYFAFDLQDVIDNFEVLTKECTLVFQKAFFDITQLRRWIPLRPRPIYDTMLLDRILWSGYFSNFSLADLSRRYLNLYMEKETRDEFETADTMNEDRYRYAALDVAATWRVLQKQLKIARPVDIEIHNKYDIPALWAILDFPGFPVNSEKWRALAERNQAKADELKKSFPFLPSSWKQVVKWFNDNGIKDKKGRALKSSGKEVLGEIDHPMAKAVLEYRKVDKLASTYGIKWLENNVEADGRVHNEYDPSMARTSRMSANGSMQQIPVRETRDFRECFVAPDGHVLIIGDYSAQEPRIATYLSKDETLMEIFSTPGKDVYVETARLVYHKDIEKKDPLRDRCKTIFLGLDYGMTSYGLASRLGITEPEAQEELRNFFAVFHGLKGWIDRQQHPREEVELATGRSIHINPYDLDWTKYVLNYPIQGSAAEMTKLALSYMHTRWPKEFGSFGVIGIIHDELIALVPEACAEPAKEFIKNCMEEAATSITPGIPAKADVVVGRSWADKK